VPFDVLLTSASSLAERDSAEPIDGEAFVALMRSGPHVKELDDRTWWISYPNGEPWFRATLDDSHALLSVCYSNPRFLRNFADMMERAATFAKALGVNAVEESGGRTFVEDDLEAMLGPTSEYVAFQARAFEGMQQRLQQEVQAMIEFPIGPFDSVPPYFAFHVVPEREVPAKKIRALLEAEFPTIDSVADGKLMIGQRPEKGIWARLVEPRPVGEWWARVLLRPDGQWQIWPAVGAPFSAHAPIVRRAAERIHEACGGELLFLGRPFTSAIRSAIEPFEHGLGVELQLALGEILGSSTVSR